MKSSIFETDLKDRTAEHLQSIGIAHSDINGLMRHILDCMGALRQRTKEGVDVSYALRRVFRDACNAIADRIGAEYPIDDGSAVDQIMDVFPDAKKKTDGRGWLPLHWACVLDTTEDDFKYIAKERPLVCQKDHLSGLSSRQLYDADAVDYGAGIGIGMHKGGEIEEKVTSITAKKKKEYRDEDHVEGLLPLHFLTSLTNCKISSLRTLLRMYPDAIKTTDKRGWLPLHWAAYNCNNDEVVAYLIDKYPAAAYCATLKGQLPFQLTTHNVNFDVVMRILDANPQGLQAVDNQGNSALHDSAGYWNVEATTRLLHLCSDLNLERNFRSQYPIHRIFAIIYPHESSKLYRQMHTLQLLIETHPDVATFQDRNGCLPLHLAVKFDSSLEVIEYLYNAFPSGALIQDKDGLVPLQYAQQLYQPDVYGESASQEKSRSPKSAGGRGRALLGTQLTVYENSGTETEHNDSFVDTDNRHHYGSGVYARHGGAGGYGGEDSDNYAIITGHDPSLSQFRPVLDSERDRRAKYIRIQQLLLGSHPTIARLGGASSFSRFGVNRK